MAKKTTDNSEAFSFSDLRKALHKVSPDADYHESHYKNIKEYFSLGNYLLNAQVSASIFNGAPSGRVTVLSGIQGSGKTFLSLNAAREAQKKGYYIVWIDSENATDREMMMKFGIDADPSKVDIHPINTVEGVIELFAALIKMVKEAKRRGITPPKIIVFIDSLGNLGTRWEMEIAQSGESGKVDMGHKPKLLKRLFRVCTVDCGVLEIPVIATNHVYEQMSLYSEPKMGGGCLTASHKVLMSDSTYKNINQINVGDFVQTLDGDKEVTNTFEYDKQTIKLTLSDGQVLECSEEHRFLVDVDLRIWKTAFELEPNDEIYAIA